MAAPEPLTISWQAALTRLTERGYSNENAQRELLTAVITGAVGYYPRKALSLEIQYRKGLLNPETGLLRVSHRDDNPWHIRVIESDFERQFPLRRSSPKVGSETKAIAFLAAKLKENPNLRRDADAREACSDNFRR